MHPHAPRSPRTLLAAVLLLLAGTLAGFLGGLAVCDQRLARVRERQAHELQQLRDAQHSWRDRLQQQRPGDDQLAQRLRRSERFPPPPHERP